MKQNAFRTAARRSPLAIALTLAFAAGAVSAQPLFSAPWYGNADMSAYSENYVSLTPLYVKGGNAKFGEWTGLHKDGGFGLLNFNAGQARDSGLAWNVSGWNLGVSSGMAAVEVGQQGQWSLGGRYQGIKHYTADQAEIYQPNPTNPYAPPVLVGTTDIELKRQTYGVAGGFAFLGNWKGFVDVSQTERKGDLMVGGFNVDKGASPLTPVKDQTQQLATGLRYTADNLQAEVAYRLSTYRNDVGNGSFTSAGQVISLMPDNDWNQFSAKGAYNFSDATRLVGTLGYSWATQNADFSSAPLGTTRTSLNGELAQTLADFTLTSRVMSKLRIKANYNYLDRNNKTDSFNYLTPPNFYPGALPNRNLTPSSTTQRATIEGTYDIARMTKLRGWYQYKDTDYGADEQSLRPGATNNQVGVELNSNANEFVSGLVRYQYDKRSGGEYRANGMLDWMQAGSKDPATLRQYWVANYDENLVRAQVNLAPSELVTVQLSGDWARRNYNGDSCGGSLAAGADTTCLGLSSTNRQAYTIDTQFTPSETLNLFVFYTWSQQKQDQASNWDAKLSTAARWTAASSVADNTVGLGGEWKLNERWKFGTQANWIYGTEKYDMTGMTAPEKPGSSSVSLVQYPDNTYTETTLQLYGSWKYSKALSLRANYQYSKLRSDDWSREGLGVAGSPANQTMGLAAPYYNTQLFAVTANLRFW